MNMYYKYGLLNHFKESAKPSAKPDTLLNWNLIRGICICTYNIPKFWDFLTTSPVCLHSATSLTSSAFGGLPSPSQCTHHMCMAPKKNHKNQLNLNLIHICILQSDKPYFAKQESAKTGIRNLKIAHSPRWALQSSLPSFPLSFVRGLSTIQQSTTPSPNASPHL